MHCSHTVGFDPDEGELIDKYDNFNNPLKVRFQYCPWCKAEVTEILKMWSGFEDDCQKGGCED